MTQNFEPELPIPVTYNPRRCNTFFACSAKTLSTIPGPILLSEIFKSFGCFTRFIGILPISIHSDGSASYAFFSRRLLHTLVYTLAFIGTSSIYLPAAFKQFTNVTDPAVIIAENLFIAGQLLGVVITTIQIPYMAKRFVPVFNGLRDVVDFMVCDLHYQSTSDLKFPILILIFCRPPKISIITTFNPTFDHGSVFFCI